MTVRVQQSPRRYETSAVHDQTNRWGAGVLVRAKSTGRFLLGKRGPDCRNPNLWASFGGMGEDFDASFAHGGCRELEEEAGVSVFPEECVLLASPEAEDGFVFHNFLADIEEEVLATINDESAGFAWFTADEMYELGDWLHPGFREVIESNRFNIVGSY